MLSDKVSADQKLPVHGFLIGTEIEEGTEIDAVMRAIGEALFTFKGVGTVDVEHLGEIDVIDDIPVVVNALPPGFDGMKES